MTLRRYSPLESPPGRSQHPRARSRQESKSAKRHALAGAQQTRLRLRLFEPHRLQLPGDSRAQIPQPRRVAAEEQEVIGITQIVSVPAGFRRPKIETVQIEVSPKLRGEIADGQTPGSRGSVRPVVIGKEGRRHVAAGAEAGENSPDESEHTVTAHQRRELREKNFVVDVGKEFRHVAFEHEGVAIGQPAAAFPRGGGAFADLAGKTARDEAPLEHRSQPVAQGVMHHAVAEGRGGDEPAFRFVDFKEAVRAGAVAAREQFLAQRGHIRFAPQPPILHIGPPALAAARKRLSHEATASRVHCFASCLGFIGAMQRNI